MAAAVSCELGLTLDWLAPGAAELETKEAYAGPRIARRCRRSTTARPSHGADCVQYDRRPAACHDIPSYRRRSRWKVRSADRLAHGFDTEPIAQGLDRLSRLLGFV